MPEHEEHEPTPFASWEIAVWLVVAAVALIVIHAMLQAAINRQNDSWAYYTPTTTTMSCGRSGCVKTP